MGRRPYSDRWIVEECKSISTKFLNTHHYFDGGIRWGWMTWSCNGEQTGSIVFGISTLEGNEYIRFKYTHTDSKTGEKSDLDYKARIVSTHCHYGGQRWWFICPLAVNGRLCSRRVGVLYLANDKRFGCRYCCNLTYQSCKEHDKRLNALFRNPALFMTYLNSKNSSQSLLALEAGLKYL